MLTNNHTFWTKMALNTSNVLSIRTYVALDMKICMFQHNVLLVSLWYWIEIAIIYPNGINWLVLRLISCFVWGWSLTFMYNSDERQAAICILLLIIHVISTGFVPELKVEIHHQSTCICWSFCLKSCILKLIVRECLLTAFTNWAFRRSNTVKSPALLRCAYNSIYQ